MIDRLVLPLDLVPESDRVLPWAELLARRAQLPVELVTVSSPGISEVADRKELGARARRLHLPTPARLTVEHSNEVADALATLLEARPASLLCMAVHGRSAVGEMMIGGVATALLDRTTRPTLLLGPGTSATAPSIDELVVCIGTDPDSLTVVEAAHEWLSTFPMPAVVVEVLGKSAPAADGAGPAAAEVAAEELAEHGHAVEWQVLSGTDSTRALLGFLAERPGRMAALATHARRGFSRIVRGSLTADLVHLGAHPLLVSHVPRDQG